MSYYDNLWQKMCEAYKDLYLRYLAARRDYPYFEHEKPTNYGFFEAELREMQEECEREFNRTL
jgi:hypothetical protein